MLHVSICDDEKIQRNELKSIINREFQLKGIDFSIDEFEYGETLVSVLAKDKNHFDIIFLDIEMNGIDGVETARQIRSLNDRVVIIFVTGYADYVFDGYEVKAFNYILKPYKKEKIVDVLSDALKQIDTIQDKFFIVQFNSNSYKLYLNDIIYFESNKRKIKIITDGNIYEFYGKLDDIENELPSFFIRIHQRYLVNINFVSSVDNDFIEVIGKKLPISRRRYQDVMIAFAKTMLR